MALILMTVETELSMVVVWSVCRAICLTVVGKVVQMPITVIHLAGVSHVTSSQTQQLLAGHYVIVIIFMIIIIFIEY